MCRLKKALYGFKQAPRTWYTKLNSYLSLWGFRSSQVVTSMMLYDNVVYLVIILIYVDDIIIA